MEFLRPILAKIELICQQPAMSRPIGVKWVLSPAVGCWIGWLGADAVFWLWWDLVMVTLSIVYVISPSDQGWGALSHFFLLRYFPNFAALNITFIFDRCCRSLAGTLAREREINFIGLFGDWGHRGPYSPYKPCNHNLYIGIIIFPHIDNPQSTGYN